MHKYILCRFGESDKHGKKIETSVNMDIYKDFDKFLDALLKKGDITPKDREEIVASYYAERV